MSKTKPKPETNRASKPILVVYGYGEDRMPKAAKFPEAEFELARKAADLMGLQVHEGDVNKLRGALKKIAVGRIYASGWGFVSNIRQAQYETLVTKLTGAKPKEPGALVSTGLPTDWDHIEVGHLVLGEADSSSDGWWPAIVTKIDGDMLTLQARDFPKEPAVKRHRTAVALLKPPAA
jgi:hypothetical protein